MEPLSPAQLDLLERNPFGFAFGNVHGPAVAAMFAWVMNQCSPGELTLGMQTLEIAKARGLVSDRARAWQERGIPEMLDNVIRLIESLRGVSLLLARMRAGAEEERARFEKEIVSGAGIFPQ